MLRSFAGGTLFGASWGEAPARVLALHGWERTHADFAGVFSGSDPALRPFGVVAPDLPGFGATPPPPVPWGSSQYADALRVLFPPLSSHGTGSSVVAMHAPAVVLGHSFGGRVAVTLAATHPELVGALVLTGVPLLRRAVPRPKVARGYRMARALHRFGLVSDEGIERARQRYGSPDYRRAQGVMRGVLVTLLGEHYEDQLAQLRCPVELVWADDDTEAPLEVALAVEERVPQAVVTRCGAVGHLTPLTAPAALRSAVERALATVAG